MTGSSAIAAWIAHVAFWVLVLWGWLLGELGPRLIAGFLFVWVAGLLGLAWLPYGKALFPSFVAVLDITLVFIVLKGDVRLT